MADPIPFGPYLLVERVAIGGMAEIFAAVRPGDPARRCYAVKRILPTLAEDEELVRMFLDEARLVRALDHPGVVAVHELGRQATGHFIAMDYVPGRDLRELIDRARLRGGGLPVALAASIAWQVADVLDHVHRRRDAAGAPLGVVHRDVSPANVLVGFDGRVRLVDFGIAQTAARGAAGRAVLRGKFGYMSPELVRGLPTDRRADVFALGVVLHEMLTCERLFTGPSELAVMERVRAAEVRPPSSRNRAVSPSLDAVVLRALAREPDDRYSWASELRDALVPFLHGVSPDDPGPLSRAMARAFPDELREEERRRARLAAAA
jgi:serine/threonine-protein kinase